MGVSPMSLKQPSHLKHRLCQNFPAAETNPPSDLSVRTGRAQVGQLPFEPPLVMKQGRHKKCVLLDGVLGSGYIVASGGNTDEHSPQEWVARDSFGWRMDP